jgi:hypothetical protein
MVYVLLFFGQGLNFLIAVLNIRAAAKGHLWLTGTTDFVFCVVSFTMIQHIPTVNGAGPMLAYATGGMLGSMLAVRISRRLKTVDADHSQ